MADSCQTLVANAGAIVIQAAGRCAGNSLTVFPTKQIKCGGSLTPTAVYKKNKGVLVQTGGHTR